MTANGTYRRSNSAVFAAAIGCAADLSCVARMSTNDADEPRPTYTIRAATTVNRSPPAYCLGMLAALTSARLVATSSLKNLSNSATVIGSFSTPIFANRSCTDDNASASMTSS